MRFQIKFKPTPKEGDIRTITSYCIFPKIIGDVVYWLEKVNIRQRYHEYGYVEMEEFGRGCWKNLYVVTDESGISIKELKRIAQECEEKGACQGNLNKLLYFIENKDKEKACRILLFHKDWLEDKGIEVDFKQVSKTAKNIGTSWYSNGQPWVEETYKDGQRHGLYKEWYSSGQPMVEETYKDGKKHGEYKSWYDDGQPYIEVTYKDGELDGEYKMWYSDGQPWVEATYKDGKLDGQYKKWHRNGQPYIEATYKDGV